jgi:SAM-dependent methyltransferase
MSTDMLDFRIFAIREPRHRTHNPLTEEQFACLGAALGLPAGASILDLGCGSGEMLCTWARDYGVTGTGIDIYPGFIASAVARAEELGVSGAVWFVASDAAGYVAGEPVDVAACVGATWIGGGVPGTLALLRQSLKPGGTLLVGEPFWRTVPTSPQVLAWSGAQSADDFLTLPAGAFSQRVAGDGFEPSLSRRFYSPLAPPESPPMTSANALRGGNLVRRGPLCVRACRGRRARNPRTGTDGEGRNGVRTVRRSGMPTVLC